MIIFIENFLAEFGIIFYVISSKKMIKFIKSYSKTSLIRLEKYDTLCLDLGVNLINYLLK